MSERDVPKELQSRKSSKQHPLKELSRALSSFQAGLGRLDSATARLGKISPSSKNHLTEHKTYVYNPVREIRPKTTELHERAVPHEITRTTFRDASAPRMPSIPPSLRREIHSATRYNIRDVVTGPEDREAITQLREVLRPVSYEGLPRAVRAALAKELKSKNPERDIKSVLPGAAGVQRGGPDAPRSVWRPEIAKMVERYHSELSLSRDRLERAERAVYGESVSSSSHSHKSASSISNTFNSTTHNVSSSPLPSNTTAEQLLELNDITHTSMQGERYEREVRKQRQLPSSGTPSRKSSPERKLPSVTGARRTAAASGSKTQASPVPSARKLSGSLTLLGQNGVVLGSANLDATEG